MNIMDSIGYKLAELFPDIEITSENTEQGFVTPSFYVYEVRRSSQDEIANYEFRNHFFCIVYFAREDSVNADNQVVANRLQDDFSTLDDLKLRLLDKEINYPDGVLNFTFKLKYRGKYVQDFDEMKNLETNGGLVNG